MKIVFFGTPSFAVPSLERLLNEPSIEVCAVVTQPDKRRGRGNRLSPSPVKEVALAHGKPVWQPQRVKKDAEVLQDLAAVQADAFVVVAYGQLLSPQILQMPRLGCINAHGSILPRYRGAAPIQWSIVHGEPETGITTMLMDEGMDTGAMLLMSKVPIAWWDTALEVGDALAQSAADLLVETLFGLEKGTITAIAQDSEQATYAPLIQKSDYELDWAAPARALHNQVRGFFPNAIATLRGQPIKILETVPLPLPSAEMPEVWAKLPSQIEAIAPALATPASPGTIVAILKNYGPVVATGNGHLLLCKLQPAGKKLQSGWDVANGMRLAVGETFT